jgi:hypothetical protein
MAVNGNDVQLRMDGTICIVIQHRVTRWYWSREGGWNADVAVAQQFDKARNAVAIIEEKQLDRGDVAVVWKSPLPNCDLVLWPRTVQITARA